MRRDDGSPDGLLCREYLATEEFEFAIDWMGGSPPWDDDVLAHQWAVGYRFLRGEPERMDLDGNGIPCELLFDATVVDEVWGGAEPVLPRD